MDLSSQTLPAGRPLTAEWVYRRYAKAIRQYFLKRVRNPAEAEDLTSELLLRVSQNADRSVQNPEGFIFSIAANLLRDRYRHQQVVDRYRRDQAAPAAGIEVLSPERVLTGKQSLDALMRALDGLDARARNVFVLSRIDGMSYAGIARLLGLSVSSIEKDMMRALAALSRHVAQSQEQDGF
ncbi:MAG TPA: sigma-70 family RNA polymerase sigma factor [Asticcacaulis sp.]|jgi:RNA polymerase sigma-70 factor (ECF subfamily)